MFHERPYIFFWETITFTLQNIKFSFIIQKCFFGNALPNFRAFSIVIFPIHNIIFVSDFCSFKFRTFNNSLFTIIISESNDFIIFCCNCFVKNFIFSLCRVEYLIQQIVNIPRYYGKFKMNEYPKNEIAVPIIQQTFSFVNPFLNIFLNF